MNRPDTAAVLAQLKGFQRDTVEYAFDRLYRDPNSSYRFLVADEVGLGKTLVARGVIAKAIDHLWDEVERLDVVYICSNTDIARQNINRLNVTGEDDFQQASRLTLLPLFLRNIRERKLNFISFTPGTSFDLKSNLGTAQERILLYWLTRKAYRETGTGALNLFQGNVRNRKEFRNRIKWFQQSGPSGRVPWDADLAKRFAADLRANEELRARYRKVCRMFAHGRKRWPQEHARARNELVGELRSMLARTCLQALEPDLVVLDEFQRFRHLLHGESEAADLAKDLFTYADESSSVRVLLLSATPYKMYTLAHEHEEDDHYADFLQTVRFLNDTDRRDGGLEEDLRRYRDELYALGRDSGERVGDARRAVEGSLRKVMARTERVGSSEAGDGMLREVPPTRMRLETADVDGFLKLQRVAQAVEQPQVVEYWKSAPYLFNFMDHYKLKEALIEKIEDAPDPSVIGALREGKDALLGWAEVERYESIDPRNARLRSLLEELRESGAMRALWLPPSATYYALGAPFDDVARVGFTKRLIFSSWMVVPRVIASLVSYEAERAAFRAFEAEPENTPEARARRRGLLDFAVEEGGRLTGMPVLGWLYPCAALAAAGDPLAVAAELRFDAPLESVLDAISQRLSGPLDALTRDAPQTGPVDERWYWAAPILLDLKADEEAAREWWAREDLAEAWSGGTEETAGSRWGEHVDRAWELVEGELELGPPPKDLLTVTTLHAVGAPSTCALRSFGRLTTGSAGQIDWETRDAAGKVGWAFRSLFNAPESMALVRADRDRGTPYWRLALEYAAAGCLQSVLDEYAHVSRDFHGLFDREGAELAQGLAEAMAPTISLRTSVLQLDEIRPLARTVEREEHRMRAHFAMRFGKEKTDGEDQGVREDLVRAAFNSPFYPFVLATTSVGQEGLDFHTYCHAVVHWNLPANPVDLEQREGRIHRFKGHAIRRNIAARFPEALRSTNGGDPWDAMFQAAIEEVGDRDRGLSPFWVYPGPDESGAYIERHVPTLPLSRDGHHLENLRRSLAVYRMVFGQPRQDDLLAYLIAHVAPEILEASREHFRIDLHPRAALRRGTAP